MSSAPTPAPLTVAHFLELAQVEPQIQALRQALEQRAEAQGRPKGSLPRMSDMVCVEDGVEYQYVDLVQEGGGMLGIALVGYVYALERMGIRFCKLAGTSAGAINTLMLAAVDPANYPTDMAGKPNRYQYQSEAVLHEMLSYTLWNLVDPRQPWWKNLIGRMLGGKGYTRKLKMLGLGLGASVVLFSLLALGLSYAGGPGWLLVAAAIISGVALAAWALVIGLTFFLRSKASQFVRAGFGICQGNAFHTWMTQILARNQATTCDQLLRQMEQRAAKARLRPERFDMNGGGYESTVSGSMLKIISCDITNENKVEFPDFSWFYYDNPGQANPADFVRASMSIPVFFEPFRLEARPPAERLQQLQQRQKAADPRTAEKLHAVLRNVHPGHTTVRFVDGGILSNFPINVFHNPKVAIARLPTWGAKLEDEAHTDPANAGPGKKASLGSYVGSIFSTLRFYYDRDFLKKNSVYQLGLAHIDVAGINWLDFNMPVDQQADLFRRGVSAATTFFLGGTFYRDGVPFDWPGYSWERYKMERKRKMID